jgi:translation initiation factor IF-1
MTLKFSSNYTPFISSQIMVFPSFCSIKQKKKSKMFKTFSKFPTLLFFEFDEVEKEIETEKKHWTVLNLGKNEVPAPSKKPKDLVDMLGVVTHNLSNGKFRVKLENDFQVIAHLSGKMRKNRIKIVVGDSVKVELSTYDLTKGRISFRHR